MFLALAGVAAVLNWIAVERKDKRLEYFAKPATTALLIAAALAMDTDQGTMRSYVVAALVLCLAGDVFLMLPQDLFVPGLASFFVAHLLFVVAFLTHEPGHSALPTLIPTLLLVPILLRSIFVAVRRDHPDLVLPVVAYAGAIGAMLAESAVTGSLLVVAGAAVFVASDTILANNRFVRPLPHGHLATMVTYHAALALLVLSLI